MPMAGKWNIYPFGLYELPRRSGEAHLYRFNHPLAEAIVARAKDRQTLSAEIHFDYGLHDGKVSILEPFIGQSAVGLMPGSIPSSPLIRLRTTLSSQRSLMMNVTWTIKQQPDCSVCPVI
uniref:Uncharacterized protein n=1 Tax=uncultured Desulfobacterium sp. TaxID=201089 RepID=E1YGF9_9BACT|nr:hypothetical protein N47_J06340 [uncultured Desulfobacterium sp.]